MIAECCLRAEVVEGTPRPMRRPDVAAKMLAKHDRLDSDPRVFSLYLEALLFDDDRSRLPRGPEEDAGVREVHRRTRTTSRGAPSSSRASGTRPPSATRPRSRRTPPTARPCSGSRSTRTWPATTSAPIELYETLAALKPPDTHALLNLGVLYEDHGRYEDAVRCYRTRARRRSRTTAARASTCATPKARSRCILDEEHERRPERGNFLLRMPISEFELSVRARNCLAKMDIQTLGDLVTKTENELLSYKNFGETTLQEIRSLLSARGLALGMKLDENGVPVEEADRGRDRRRADPSSRALGPVPIPEGIDPKTLNIVLSDLELSLRCRRALTAIKANTVGDLLTHTEAELLALKNFGLTSLNELKTKLAEFGVSLKSS